MTSRGDGREISTSIRQEDHQDFSRAMRPAMDLTPYWINPTALEPDRITYQLLIDIEYTRPLRDDELLLEAQSGTTNDMPCPHSLSASTTGSRSMGCRTAAGPARWLVPRSLCCELLPGVDRSSTGSTTVGPQSDCVAVSGGKVVRARYGLEEVETGYVVWMGGCEKPDSPWPKPETRVEHMADLAMRQTLICALDVEGLRLHFGVGPETLSDERLLVSLHRARAKSRHVPLQARVESQQWLREHRELVAAAESWDCGGMSAPS